MSSPSNIILISDPRVLEIPIQENDDPMVEVKNLKTKDEGVTLRKSVASKLFEAEKALPHSLRFLIVEGYRSLETQKKYFNEYTEKLTANHPDWTTERIKQEASKYVAPPNIIPPHSTGGAVDLTLIDQEGKEIDMGPTLNTSPEDSANTCFTDALNISNQAKENRTILIQALHSVGFVNYPTEWWHWSYGDRYWAYCTKQPHALFGSV